MAHGVKVWLAVIFLAAMVDSGVASSNKMTPAVDAAAPDFQVPPMMGASWRWPTSRVKSWS
jgi:hypothetical protein